VAGSLGGGRFNTLVDAFDERWPPILALVVFATALWAQTGAMVGVFFDDGIYVGLAKSLAEGTGYRSIHLPNAPHAVHYPPLYPMALAVLWKLWPSFPANVTLFKLFDSAMLAAAAWIVASHARRMQLPRPAQYIAVALGMTAFPMLTLVGVRFSEPFFLVLFAGAVAVADRDQVRVTRGVAAGVLAGLSTLTRSIGLSAVVGIPIALWLRRQRAAAMVSAVVGVLVASPWWLWLAQHTDGIDARLASNYGTYTQFAGQAGLSGLLMGLDLRALGPFPRLLLPGLPSVMWVALAALLAAAVVVGIVTLVPRVPTLGWVLLPYTGIVTLWPFTPDRFMWILLPWVGLFGTGGALQAWRWGRVPRLLTVVLAVAVVWGFGWFQTVSLLDRRFTVTADRSSHPFALLTSGISTAVPDDAVIASDGEAMVYLYTGRKAVPAYLFRLDGRRMVPYDVDSTTAYFCESGVTHLGTSWLGGDLLPLFEALQETTSTLTPLFVVTNGPALFRFQCPA
jgi:hypothetical protein